VYKRDNGEDDDEDWSEDEDDKEKGADEEEKVARRVLARSCDEMFQEIIREKPSPEKYLKLSRLAHDVR